MAARNRIQVLNLEVDRNDVSDYRVLVDGASFKYFTIDPGIFLPEDMCFIPSITQQLPPLPDQDDWNQGHIARHPESGQAYFSEYLKVDLPSISCIWHPTRIDWLQLELGAERIRSNIYPAVLKRDIGPELKEGDEVVIKFARFPWEMPYFEHETQIYKCIEGQGQAQIAPKFFGHLTEEGGTRVIGLVIEHIRNARHAGPEDVEVCQDALRKFHDLGMLHGDVNRHNFLIREAADRQKTKTVTIIDLECASDCKDQKAFDQELDRLREELHSTDGKGGYYIDSGDKEEEEESDLIQSQEAKGSSVS